MTRYIGSRLMQAPNFIWAALVTLIVIFFFGKAVYAIDDYPNTVKMGGEADKNSGWYKQCISVKDTQPPQTDLPPLKSSSTVKCNAIDLYYETKNSKQNNKEAWKKVMHCAFTENSSEVLMMLYANGFGVSKNVNLAIKYACKVGGAPAEVDGRVMHLTGMKDDEDDGVFDLCDDITSGFMQGVCTSISEQQEQKARSALQAEIVNKFSKIQQEAFNKLMVSLTDFAKHRGNDETDTSGSGRAAFMIEAEAEVKDRFLSDLEKFESGNTPRFTNDEFSSLDKELNQLYQKIMRTKIEGADGLIGYGTVTKDGIKQTQKSWLKYRDAWVNFGRTRYPSVDDHSWMGHLSKHRIDQLKVLLGTGE